MPITGRLLGALTLASLLAASATAQTENRSIKGDRVAIYNLAGRLQVVAGSGDAVAVEVLRGGADAAKLKIETGQVRGRESLRIVYPGDRVVYPDARRSRTSVSVREDGTFSDGGWSGFRSHDRVDIRGSGPGLEAFADLVVRVPKGQRIELYLAVGRVEVTNVEGDLLLDVSSATVDVSGTKGPLSLDTGSGRVSVRDVAGDVHIDAGSGGVMIDRVKGDKLHLDSGSGGVQGTDVDVKELRADVGSGGLRFYRTRAPSITVETGSGGALLELLADVSEMKVETGSGGVTIRAPANLSVELDAETGSGGFQTDFEITTRRLSRNRVAGTIGGGKGRIRLEAGSGTVRLLKGQ